jgi:hypothetical protein
MSEDLVKVVIDYNQAELNVKESIPTGRWKKIFQGGEVNSSLQPNAK